MPRNFAGIGQQAEAPVAVRKYKLEWLAGVMRYRKWLNFQRLDAKSGMTVDDSQINASCCGPESMIRRSTPRAADRQAENVPWLNQTGKP